MKILVYLHLITIVNVVCVNAQNLKSIVIEKKNGFEITSLQSSEGEIFNLSVPTPVISLEINGERYISTGQNISQNGDLPIDNRLLMTVTGQGNSGSVLNIKLKNITTSDTLEIKNIIPFGENPDNIYLTGKGEERLSRTKLFVPGKSPVSVIVPDNAWEMGFSIIDLNRRTGLYGLARRTKVENGTKRRFWTNLYPGGELEYTLYFDLFSGHWQEGLRKCFQEKYLYDLKTFDETLYQREDLAWIREAYVIHLMMAWDHHFYDSQNNRYMVSEFLERGKEWYGGDDVIGIWPTWPTLGLDERNQWDLYHDLPGGIPALLELSSELKSRGTKLFISYNPWDESTRMEDHLIGMAELIKDIDADGVVLDTRGSSSIEIQQAADHVKEGVVMLSEGMAIPEDMPGIISGRVHNALYYPPVLNLNKLIRPDFAIFRVAELTYERIRREYALAFFNGYGTEINMFKPGQPNWIEEDYRFLGRTTRILRENHNNFIMKNWVPLISNLMDSVYVNEWPGSEKTLYTIFSQRSEGFSGPLFQAQVSNEVHYVDMWNHKEINPEEVDGRVYIPVSLDPFKKEYLGTNNEGAVGCIAKFPAYLEVSLVDGKASIKSNKKGIIRIWQGSPDYSKSSETFSATDLVYDPGRYEGDLVIQLFEENKLLDERVLFLSPGQPKLISKVQRTKPLKKAPKGMIKIPAGKFSPSFLDADDFIYYPKYEGPDIAFMDGFFMDVYPVTNGEFHEFLKESGYSPEDTVNFLKHWDSNKMPPYLEMYPVVYVSKNDAIAYSEWAGKRLPTELEWQFAAQTEANLQWPWGNDFDSLRCNAGNGKPDPVDKYPNGINPNGLSDLVGNVWQLTSDTYESGSYSYSILKGGSYFKPTSSWWYVKGGPQPLPHRQILLHVSDGFERNATVGFRCVVDTDN